MQRRYEISDEQWNKIKHMFPKAKTGRPGKDLRLMFNAVLWIACSGAPWRDLPERFGSWKTVCSSGSWRDLLNVSVHGRRSIPVSANGVTRGLCLKYLSI